MSPLRMFGVLSAVVILLVTLLYAVCLCIFYRSFIHLSLPRRVSAQISTGDRHNITQVY